MSNQKPSENYLHGFTPTEQQRLRVQARLLEFLIYQDINFSGVKNLIEVGCGVGAQSEILLRRFPDLSLQGVDLNESQLEAAQKYLDSLPVAQSRFQLSKADASDLHFDSEYFDGAFICWLLEHLPHPSQVLAEIRRVLRPRAPLVVTEVMNSSFFLEPYSPNVWKYWMEFNDHQYENGGDPFVGAKLGNLLLSAGFSDIETRVKTMFSDKRRPAERKRVIAFWKDLLLSASDQLIQAKRVDQDLVDEMTREFDEVARDPNAVFFYSFIQAHARA